MSPGEQIINGANKSYNFCRVLLLFVFIILIQAEVFFLSPPNVRGFSAKSTTKLVKSLGITELNVFINMYDVAIRDAGLRRGFGTRKIVFFFAM